MNSTQKIVLVIWAVVVLFFSTIWVPFEAKHRAQFQGSAIEKYRYYYASIWSDQAPHDDKRPAEEWFVEVNTDRWAVQVFAITVVAGVVFALVGKKKKEE